MYILYFLISYTHVAIPKLFTRNQLFHDILCIFSVFIFQFFVLFLGHQKKFMLSIDRLRRIDKGQYRPPSLRASQEVLDPASPFAPRTFNFPRAGAPQSPPGGTVGSDNYVSYKPRSPSMDNLINRGIAGSQMYSVPDSTRVYASRKDVYAQRTPVHMRAASVSSGSHYHVPQQVLARAGSESGSLGSDVIAIQVHRNANTTPTPDMNQSGSSSHQQTRLQNSPKSDAQNQLLNTSLHSRLRHLSGPTSVDVKMTTSVTSLSDAMSLSPAHRTKLASDGQYSRINGHNPNLQAAQNRNYSSGSLPRHASMKNAAGFYGDHVYESPNAVSKVGHEYAQLQVPLSNTRPVAPSSPRHTTASSDKPRKSAPPPPPKRTNSIKHSSHLPNKPVHPALRKTGLAGASEGGQGSDDEQHCQPSPPQAMPLLSNDYGLGGRLANNSRGDTSPTKSHYAVPSPTKSSNSVPSSAGVVSPLSDAIHQLQLNVSSLAMSGARTAGHSVSTMSNSEVKTNTVASSFAQRNSNNNASQRPAIAEKPAVLTTQRSANQRASNEVSTSSECFDSSGSDSDSSRQNTLKRGAGATLPFANENVGTIKQRQQSTSKPSIVTASDVTIQDGGDDVTTRQVELRAGVFEDTDTMKRNKKINSRDERSSTAESASSQPAAG